MRTFGFDKGEFQHLSPSYGYLIVKTPQNVLDDLKNDIDKKIQSNFSDEISHVDRLAGEIKHEYRLNPQPSLINFLKDCNNKFDSYSNFYEGYFNSKFVDSKSLFKKGLPLSMNKDVWVNFQKKHEYNPIHSHTGLVSWVLWYQIPYTFKEETKFSAKVPNNMEHGDFNFIYNHAAWGPQTISLNADKSAEGFLAMFPSTLNHKVNPFYSSDDYRITISGNFTISELSLQLKLINS